MSPYPPVMSTEFNLGRQKVDVFRVFGSENFPSSAHIRPRKFVTGLLEIVQLVVHLPESEVYERVTKAIGADHGHTKVLQCFGVLPFEKQGLPNRRENPS